MKKIKYLGLIPARGGSKGVKNKNICSLGGKPLIQHTIESAKNSLLLDEVNVSSDSQKIINISKDLGAISYYKRPNKLSNDTAGALNVILYHINWLKNKNIIVENLVYLQPTSPIRGSTLIDDAIKKFELNKSNSLVTLSECSQHPYETVSIVDNKIIEFPKKKEYVRRQDFPKFLFITGSIYIYKVESILQNQSIIDKNTDYFITSVEEGLDIDNFLDFKTAESLL